MKFITVKIRDGTQPLENGKLLEVVKLPPNASRKVFEYKSRLENLLKIKVFYFLNLCEWEFNFVNCGATN